MHFVTGRPKAVKISFSKVLVFPQISLFFSCRPDDVIYCALPFYHTAGCMAGLMCALNAGQYCCECFDIDLVMSQLSCLLNNI